MLLNLHLHNSQYSNTTDRQAVSGTSHEVCMCCKLLHRKHHRDTTGEQHRACVTVLNHLVDWQDVDHAVPVDEPWFFLLNGATC